MKKRNESSKVTDWNLVCMCEMRMCISLYRCHLKISLKSHHKWWKGRQQQQQNEQSPLKRFIWTSLIINQNLEFMFAGEQKIKHWNWSIYKQHWIVYDDAHTQNNKTEYELNSRCVHVSVCMNVSRINTTPKDTRYLKTLDLVVKHGTKCVCSVATMMMVTTSTTVTKIVKKGSNANEWINEANWSESTVDAFFIRGRREIHNFHAPFEIIEFAIHLISIECKQKPSKIL